MTHNETFHPYSSAIKFKVSMNITFLIFDVLKVTPSATPTLVLLKTHRPIVNRAEWYIKSLLCQLVVVTDCQS